MLDLPLWVQWTVAVVFAVTNLGTVAWVLAVMWPFVRRSRRSMDEGDQRSAELVAILKRKFDKPKTTEIDI